jgi:hypothetical protein
MTGCVTHRNIQAPFHPKHGIAVHVGHQGIGVYLHVVAVNFAASKHTKKQ